MVVATAENFPLVVFTWALGHFPASALWRHRSLAEQASRSLAPENDEGPFTQLLYMHRLRCSQTPPISCLPFCETSTEARRLQEVKRSGMQ